MDKRQDGGEEHECGACQFLIFYAIQNYVRSRVRLIGELNFLFSDSTPSPPKLLFLAMEVIK